MEGLLIAFKEKSLRPIERLFTNVKLPASVVINTLPYFTFAQIIHGFFEE